MDHGDLRAMLAAAHLDARAWAVRCSGDRPDDADDLLQGVYVAVLEGKARYDGRSAFRTWLYGVIRISAANRRRRLWLHRLLLERHGNRVAPTAPPPADHSAERASRASRLRAAVGRLSVRQREMVELVFYHELTVEEAAGVLGLALGTARTHFARGKARLATMLADLKEG